MKTIGEFLKHLREQKELSTVQVQSQSGGRISQSYVIQVEQNQRTPSVEKLQAFADVYGANIHDMIDVMIAAPQKKITPPMLLSGKEIALINHIRNLPDKKKKAIFDLFIR